MEKFIRSFKDKRFKYGSFSAIMIAVVIAVLIIINLCFSQLDIKFDLTSEGMYTISDTSKDILKDIDDNITIYALFKTGSENTTTTEILEQYADTNKNIKVEYIDPYLYPRFTEKYDIDGTGISTGSVIVESGDKFKVISQSELVSYDYDYQTGSTTLKSIDVEPQVTNAIKYVTMDKLPKIYYVTGHNELINISNNLMAQLQSANYEVTELDLFKSEKVPDDCSVLMLSTPNTDYSEKEAQMVKDYIANDGRALIVGFLSGDLPNFESILNAYGIENDRTIICETNASYSIPNYPTYILPQLNQGEINQELLNRNSRVLIYMAQPLKVAELKKNSLEIEPILSSSKDSYSKRLDASSINFENGDPVGPFNIGVAITDTVYTDKNHISKLVVLGSLAFLDDNIDLEVSGGNSNYLVNAFNWLNDTGDNVYISPKSLESESILVNGLSAVILVVVCCVIIPFGLFITGFIIWIKRRNK